jgi:hypothetical protein
MSKGSGPTSASSSQVWNQDVDVAGDQPVPSIRSSKAALSSRSTPGSGVLPFQVGSCTAVPGRPQQRLADKVLDDLADGLTCGRRALFDLSQQVLVDRDRGPHASKHGPCAL